MCHRVALLCLSVCNCLGGAAPQTVLARSLSVMEKMRFISPNGQRTTTRSHAASVAGHGGTTVDTTPPETMAGLVTVAGLEAVVQEAHRLHVRKA